MVELSTGPNSYELILKVNSGNEWFFSKILTDYLKFFELKNITSTQKSKLSILLNIYLKSKCQRLQHIDHL